jgi:hypothetical protein
VPTPRPSPARLTRRSALVGLAAVGTVGCTPYDDAAQRQRRRQAAARRSEATPTPDVDPDVVLAARVLRDEQAVLDRVEAILAEFPGLRDDLETTQAMHAAHIALLEEAVPDPADPKLPDEPSTLTSGRMPRDRRRALLSLARTETELGLVGKQSAFAAQSGAFARVLGSMAASAAQQSVLVRQVASGGDAA